MTFSLRRGASSSSNSFHTCTPSSFLEFIGLSLGGIEFQRMGQDSCLSAWNHCVTSGWKPRPRRGGRSGAAPNKGKEKRGRLRGRPRKGGNPGGSPRKQKAPT